MTKREEFEILAKELAEIDKTIDELYQKSYEKLDQKRCLGFELLIQEGFFSKNPWKIQTFPHRDEFLIVNCGPLSESLFQFNEGTFLVPNDGKEGVTVCFDEGTVEFNGSIEKLTDFIKKTKINIVENDLDADLVKAKARVEAIEKIFDKIK
jgi:hypothetical protein